MKPSSLTDLLLIMRHDPIRYAGTFLTAVESSACAVVESRFRYSTQLSREAYCILNAAGFDEEAIRRPEFPEFFQVLLRCDF